ncbi:MAG: hypothetical protein H0X63_10025, partial [Flavobacteriales bacterium]|nr:hypothetical protein [Flavobacteriales bacterium]
CKPISGLKSNCKLIAGLTNKTVNFFQDETLANPGNGTFPFAPLTLTTHIGKSKRAISPTHAFLL